MKKLLLAFSLSMATSSPTLAGFSVPETGPVGDALGGAFAAKADDVYTVFVNPAGLRRLPRAEVGFSYGTLYSGLEGGSFGRSSLAVSRPMGGRTSIGAGLISFEAANKLSEREVSLGVGVDVLPGLTAGLGASYLQHSYDIGGDARAQRDPVFSKGTSKSAWGLDAGVLFSRGGYRAGFSSRRINRPDVGIATEDRVPVEWRGGVGATFRRVDLAADVVRRDAGSNVANGRSTTFGGGVEYSVSPVLRARLGVGTDRVTAGFGVAINDFRIDYSLSLVTVVGDNSGSHRMALRYMFGAPGGQSLRASVPAASPSPAMPAKVKTTPAATSNRAAPSVEAVPKAKVGPSATPAKTNVPASATPRHDLRRRPLQKRGGEE